MIIKDLVSKFLKRKGYEFKRIPAQKTATLHNIFSTKYSKTVLLSYLTEPFISGTNLSHSNSTECITAAEIFRDLDYNVDVVNFDDNSEIDFSKYDIVYGQHLPLEKAFYCKNTEKLMKIFYSTGNSHFYYFPEAAKAVNNFHLMAGKFIPESGRINHFITPLQFLCSDYIIALGNSFTRNTYRDIGASKCQNLNAFYYDIYNINLDNKNYSDAKSHFVWFGSAGLISKGLSACIEIFSKRSDCTLHICGSTKGENRFWNYYSEIVASSPNIFDHGFVNMQSEEFASIMDNSCFAIFPSVSEGGSPALLNVMANGGLIPLASEACGVDIDHIGFTINPLDSENINRKIDQVLSLSKEDVYVMSKKVKDFVRTNYTLEKYRENLFQIIRHAIDVNSSKINKGNY